MLQQRDDSLVPYTQTLEVAHTCLTQPRRDDREFQPAAAAAGGR